MASHCLLFLMILMLFGSLCSSYYGDYTLIFDIPMNVELKEDEIIKALWDADFKIMSILLKPNLCFVNRCTKQLSQPNDQITIFVPQDEAVRFERYFSLHDHVVTSRVDKYAFDSKSISTGSVLDTCFAGDFEKLVVTNIISNSVDNNLDVFLNHTRITKWNIYNDGQVIVHGIENFFDDHDPRSVFRKFADRWSVWFQLVSKRINSMVDTFLWEYRFQFHSFFVGFDVPRFFMA